MNPPCKIGDRIRLTRMENDPDPIPVGTTGTVTRVFTSFHGHDAQISVKWDISRSLALIWPHDQFEVIG